MAAYQFVAVSTLVGALLSSGPEANARQITDAINAQAHPGTAGHEAAQSLNEAKETPTKMPNENPFLNPSPLFLHYPEFDRIEDAHYVPAFETGMREQLVEIASIAEQASTPTVDNTLVPFELSGQTLARVSRVFFGLNSAHTHDAMKDIETTVAPLLAAHRDQILLNRPLFSRIEHLYAQRAAMNLDAEAQRLIERTHLNFVRAGAALGEEQQRRLRAINIELATLKTRFSQNVLNEVNELAIVVDHREALSGLSDAQIQTAAAEAEQRDLKGKFVIPLLNTTQQPLMSSLQNRELRRRMLETSLQRGSRGGDYDNRAIVSQTAALRAERAALLGYASHAAYMLADQTAKTVTAVNERLAALVPPAVANARREAADLQTIIDAEGGDFKLAAWDWTYYADKLRWQRYGFDAAQLKPYLELNSVLLNGVFFAAERIYGIRFVERFDLPVYHADVRVFEVFDENDETLALFIFDAYARASKRGGAWMSAYVDQSHLADQRPIVANHLNVPEPPPGEPTLLTFEEVTTMFHEFGHALHGMFSNVHYPSFAGTSVPRDFVEYPSQVNEMWSTWPEVLANYARHYQSKAAIPSELLEKVLAAEQFNQGYATTEYLAAAVTDQAIHQLATDQIPDAEQLLHFETDALDQAGAGVELVPPRYRYGYYSHILGGYAAGYYAYIWSEVLDADTVEWFKENGGMTRANGQHFRATVLSRGGSAEAMSLFQDFAGREARLAPLLKRRGLD